VNGRTPRFDPPATQESPELLWTLLRAYGPRERPVPEASALALAPRIAMRQPSELLARELGEPALDRLRRERGQAVAQALLLDRAAAEADAAAADLRIPYAPLKGFALRLAGYVAEGTRFSSDLDLLVAEEALDRFQRELERRGFAPCGSAYEHQAPPLRHPQGGIVELHRTIPGLRMAGGRSSAGFATLASAGGFDAAARAGLATSAGRLRGDLRLPRREILTAHALLHGIAQHGFSPGRFPGMLLFADLLDLGFRGGTGGSTLATISPWIALEVDREEAEAALEAVDALAAGRLPPSRPERSPGRALFDHFVVGALDAGYAESLKLRLLERPLTDRTAGTARAALLWRTLVPPREPGQAWGSWLLALARRPWGLARRGAAAARAESSERRRRRS
jgi:hypothetical protein